VQGITHRVELQCMVQAAHDQRVIPATQDRDGLPCRDGLTCRTTEW
jgi:hypothetical protein